ncbi:glycosyltransferase family 2 protein [Salibacteraceae bacterium]|nr:glycosyltransferase family 2 protein [Salibacteraceae bacterium]
MTSQQIDLVLPVYNPQKGWLEYVQKKRKALSIACGKTVRLIIVDDGSTEMLEAQKIQTSPDIELVRFPRNQGKGAALRRGFEKANAPIVLFTDIDFPYEIASMVQVARSIENGADVSLGYREDDYYDRVPWFRKLLSESFRFVLKTILRFPITDTQCGLKGMSQRGKSIFLQTKIKRFLVDMEFIKRAIKAKELRIEPVIVQLRDDVVFSKMGIRVIAGELVNFIWVFFV